NPRHPYTEALFNALPDKAAEHQERLYSIPGAPPDLTNPPAACRFAPRCRYVQDRCRQEKPRLLGESPDHRFACFYPVGEAEKKGATVTAVEPPPAALAAAAPLTGTGSLLTGTGSLLSIEHLVKDFPVTKGA